jgi:hypothetical protein
MGQMSSHHNSPMTRDRFLWGDGDGCGCGTESELDDNVDISSPALRMIRA